MYLNPLSEECIYSTDLGQDQQRRINAIKWLLEIDWGASHADY
jgi:hypothetical protein